MYEIGGEILDARENLMRMKLADFPKLKRQDRQKLHKQTHRAAYPHMYEASEQKSLTTKQLGAKLADMLGVKR